ncbi:MAG: HNH endonuclease [Bacteroidetes bacterium]|nr:HNH endonuclease [Bacteroidota bacterium]
MGSKFKDPEFRAKVHAKTDGRCHLCWQKVRHDVSNDHPLAMEVDHSKPRAKGGSDHGHNLLPACKRCNRQKGSRFSTGQMRSKYGNDRFKRAQQDSGLGWLLLGGTVAVVAIVLSRK